MGDSYHREFYEKQDKLSYRSMNHWYLVHTKIRQELHALENLQRQGYECFLPTIKAEKLLGGLLQIVNEPLFPRYLFIKLGTDIASKSWAPIRSTLGVSRLVTFGQTPSRIDEQLLVEIRTKTESSEVQLRKFEKGDLVLVNNGPFVGVEAIFQMADGESRVIVLLNILSKQVRMTVPPSSIRKINTF